MPRRNFSLPPSSHPRPTLLPPNTHSSAPHPICLKTFITLQDSCMSNLQEEAVCRRARMSEGEGVMEKIRGLNIGESAPPHAVLNSTLSSGKCSIQKHFKMPHTKRSQSSKFIPRLSLISLKVKTARFSLPRRQRSLSQFTLYPFSIFSPQFTLQKISPLEPGETQRVLQRAEYSE